MTMEVWAEASGFYYDACIAWIVEQDEKLDFEEMGTLASVRLVMAVFDTDWDDVVRDVFEDRGLEIPAEFRKA